MFIGRKNELDFLEDKYNSSGGQLIVFYGRRRIGKTETLRKFVSDKSHVFYSCRQIPDNEQLEAFSRRILDAGNPASEYIDAFQNWESAFKSIVNTPSDNGKKIVVIDEFPYMCKINKSIPSILQVLWDEILHSENIMLILCGSAMSFIEKEILSEKNPLYGRATGIYKMKELPFEDAIKFFPNYTPEEKIEAYAILGGIPHYLKQFNPKLSVRENIINNILTKGCALYSEVEFLIRQELREATMYNSIIEAIALGNTRLNEIYTKTQIEKSKISVYLKNLLELQIIEREFSVLSGKKEKSASTKGIYQIKDNFFRFWYSFVFPNYTDVESGDTKGVYKFEIEPVLNDFIAQTFERVCLDFVRRKNHSEEFPFRISKLGRWWGKVKQATTENGKVKQISVETEVDIVAIDTNSSHYILGECKYRNALTDYSVLEHLMNKSSLAKPNTDIIYMLFSKSGFTKKLLSYSAENTNIRLVLLDEILE